MYIAGMAEVQFPILRLAHHQTLFRRLTLQNLSGLGTAQGSYAFGVAAGSTTFTCTPASSQSFQAMVVLQYHGGSLSALDTQVGTTVTSNTTWTSPSFTTTAQGLIIACASANNSGVVLNSGLIGGASATMRGVSGAAVGGVSDAGCEDINESGSQAGITAAMSTGSVNWVGTAAGFK